MLRVFLALLCNLLLNGLVFGALRHISAATGWKRKHDPAAAPSTNRTGRSMSSAFWQLTAAALTKHVLPMIFLIPLLWFLCGFLQLRVLEPIIRSKLKANFYRNKQ